MTVTVALLAGLWPRATPHQLKSTAWTIFLALLVSAAFLDLLTQAWTLEFARMGIVALGVIVLTMLYNEAKRRERALDPFDRSKAKDGA